MVTKLCTVIVTLHPTETLVWEYGAEASKVHFPNAMNNFGFEVGVHLGVMSANILAALEKT
jgi:hypothetical protein